MQAALGIAQMKKLPKVISKRKIYDTYMRELQHLSGLAPAFIDPRTSPVYWFTSFLCENIEEFSDYLLKHKIQTRRFFIRCINNLVIKNQQPKFGCILNILFQK